MQSKFKKRIQSKQGSPEHSTDYKGNSVMNYGPTSQRLTSNLPSVQDHAKNPAGASTLIPEEKASEKKPKLKPILGSTVKRNN